MRPVACLVGIIIALGNYCLRQCFLFFGGKRSVHKILLKAYYERNSLRLIARRVKLKGRVCDFRSDRVVEQFTLFWNHNDLIYIFLMASFIYLNICLN